MLRQRAHSVYWERKVFKRSFFFSCWYLIFSLKRKRRFADDDEEFEVLQTNTSTPETAPASKRFRRSLTTPFITLCSNGEIKKFVDLKESLSSRKELQFVSSPDTSSKEEDLSFEAKSSPVIDGKLSPIKEALKPPPKVRQFK